MQKPIQEWFKETYLDKESPNYVSEDLIYRKGGPKQVMFVRDQIAPLVFRGLSTDTEDGYKSPSEQCAFVISEHHSKSCTLPVYSLEPPGKGIIFTLRDNFYDWKVSVEADREVEIDDVGLFRGSPPVAPDYGGNYLHPVYFEGFPKSRIFGCYSENKQEFSVMLESNYQLYTFIFLVMRAYEGDEWRERQRKADEETLKRAAAYREKTSSHA